MHHLVRSFDTAAIGIVTGLVINQARKQLCREELPTKRTLVCLFLTAREVVT
jgi:hypothetical protein